MWSTLQVKVGTVSRRRGCGDAEGVCLSFQHGKNDGKVTLDNKAITLYEPGNACAHDSSQDVHFAPFNGFRVVVTALLLESAKEFPQQAKGDLHKLGFPGWQQPREEVAMVGAERIKRSVKQWAAFHERRSDPAGRDRSYLH